MILQDKMTQYRESMHMGYELLIDLLPLDTPLSVNIDPTNKCNFSCQFCPTGSGKGKTGILSDYVFKAIEQLQDFPRPVKSLWFVKDGEPLLYPNIAEAINYAKRLGVAEQIKLTTNASRLSGNMALRLLESGLDYIKFSIYDHTSINVQGRVLEKVRRFYRMRGHQEKPHIHCKMIDVGLNDQQKQAFLRVFSPICDTINIDSLMGWSGETGRVSFAMGKEPTTGMDGVTTLKGKIICPEPFKSMAVNADGSVTTCCVDYLWQNRYGHLEKATLKELWDDRFEFHSLPMIRKYHIDGNRYKLSPCRGCHYLLGLPETQNLDNHVEKLREIYA